MRDGIEFQKRGIPTVTICYELFDQAAIRQASALGYANLPLAIIPQAKAEDDHAVFRRRAESALPSILDALIGRSASPVDNMAD